MIASREDNVESKVLSNRKTGKEEHVANCVTCSFTCVLYGFILRVKGVTQEENTEELISILPKTNKCS